MEKGKVEINIGDKVCYLGSYGLQIGKVLKKFKYAAGFLDPYYYLIDNYDKYVYHRNLMKYENDLDIYDKPEEIKEKKYRVKKYNYLFLTYEENIGLKLYSIKINATDKLKISEILLEKFPKLAEYHGNILILTKRFSFKEKRYENRFEILTYDIYKSKFNIKPSEWTKIEDSNEYKEWEISYDTDLMSLSREIGKDIKYLLYETKNMYMGYDWRRILNHPQTPSQLKLVDLFEKQGLEVYYNSKKDLCSNGDEVLF